MPKIIRPGLEHDPVDPFSYRVGGHAACGSCGCLWQVEAQDHFNAVKQDQPLAGVFVACPNCGRRATVHPSLSYADGPGQVQIR